MLWIIIGSEFIIAIESLKWSKYLPKHFLAVLSIKRFAAVHSVDVMQVFVGISRKTESLQTQLLATKSFPEDVQDLQLLWHAVQV